ncbi:TRAP transporter substrate-binding protein [Marinimicrococcus flavescens]|uniref:TRAP transporter substrate-binding protein DctP n=1 Tax=Marinimicrococcus flavescens TaxID=3031815 RepID=A0AAP3V2G0_9PROT|nr:TRAP transporter substrate-binding protein DctP [Marinimicrococcus flavescens]
MKPLARLAAAFCGAAALIGTMSAQAQEFTLRITNPDAPYVTIGDLKYPYYVYGMMSSFGSTVEALSKGRIKAEVYHSGTLGDLRENMESVRMGVLEATTPSEGPVSIWYPDIQVITIPYVFKNAAVAWEVMDGPFGQKLMNGMIEKGFRPVAIGENGGFRIWGNNKRPIQSPADLEGLKIRTMEIPAHQEMVRSLGASPTAVPWMEVYTALQTGVVDGAELPTVGSLQQNLGEVLKYVTVDNHVYSLSFVIVSEKWFQKLPPELQEAVLIAGRVGTVTSRGLVQVTVNDAMAEFAKRGVEVTYVSADEQQKFREKAQPGVIKWMEEQLGAELVGEFMEAVKAAEAKVGSSGPR